jgi:hypothetical protein
MEVYTWVSIIAMIFGLATLFLFGAQIFLKTKTLHIVAPLLIITLFLIALGASIRLANTIATDLNSCKRTDVIIRETELEAFKSNLSE